MSTHLTPRFAEAMRYAYRWHAAQTRKGTRIPYLSHLLAVASIALEYGADEDEAIAALLHDSLEDGPAIAASHGPRLNSNCGSALENECCRSS